jgi:hypothetical protein
MFALGSRGAYTSCTLHSASLHPCIPASLHPCIPASLHPCIPAPLHLRPNCAPPPLALPARRHADSTPAPPHPAPSPSRAAAFFARRRCAMRRKRRRRARPRRASDRRRAPHAQRSPALRQTPASVFARSEKPTLRFHANFYASLPPRKPHHASRTAPHTPRHSLPSLFGCVSPTAPPPRFACAAAARGWKGGRHEGGRRGPAAGGIWHDVRPRPLPTRFGAAAAHGGRTSGSLPRAPSAPNSTTAGPAFRAGAFPPAELRVSFLLPTAQ